MVGEKSISHFGSATVLRFCSAAVKTKKNEPNNQDFTKLVTKLGLFCMVEVCFIIVTFNSADYISRCISSINVSAAGRAFEIVVIDNASTDITCDVVEQEYGDVCLVKNKVNRGFACGANQGIQKTEAPYVVVVNPDACLAEDAVSRALEVLENRQDVAVVGGQLLKEDGSLQNSVAPFPSLATELGNKSILRLVNPDRYASKTRDGVAEVESLVGACVFLRRAALDSVGLFDEDYFLFFEETELCYRMRKCGFKVMFDPRIRVRHAQGHSARVFYYRTRIEYAISRYHFFAKNYGSVKKNVLMIGLIVKHLVNFLANALAVVCTLGAAKVSQQKCCAQGILFLWHIVGLPNGWRLKEVYAGEEFSH